MKRVLVYFSLFSIFLLSTSVMAKDVWIETKTVNFRIFGNVEEKEILEIANDLESFHANFQNVFNKFQIKTPFPTTVIVLRKNTNLFNQKQIFIEADDSNYIIIDLENNKSDTFSNIFHDYTHFLIKNNFGQHTIPAWLNEGLVEYFAKQTKDSNILISQQNNLLPLDLLLETDNFTLKNQTVERKAIFNDQSWAFLSFLINEKSSGHFDKIEEFIEYLKQEKKFRESLISVFNLDLKTLQNEFNQFLKHPKLVINNNLSKIPKSATYQVKLISEAESLALIGDYYYYSDQPKAAIENLERALSLEQDQSLALTTLALIKANEYYYQESADLAEKAIFNEPDNFLNYYRYALVLSKRGMTEYGFVSGYSSALAAEMRKSLNKSIELNPNFIESYALLTFVNFVRNEHLDESLIFIKKALEISPGNPRYLLHLSEINLRLENFSQARKIALEIFQNTSNSQLRLYSQNTIQRIDSTEYQLEKLRKQREKNVNDDIVTDKPLTEDEIRKLREKATIEQIRGVLRRPNIEETRVLATLTRIDCGKEKVDLIFKTQDGPIKFQAKSLDGITLISFIEEMSDFRLGCGYVAKENNASIIFKKTKGSTNPGELISIEFVPKGFKLQN